MHLAPGYLTRPGHGKMDFSAHLMSSTTAYVATALCLLIAAAGVLSQMFGKAKWDPKGRVECAFVSRGGD